MVNSHGGTTTHFGGSRAIANIRRARNGGRRLGVWRRTGQTVKAALKLRNAGEPAATDAPLFVVELGFVSLIEQL